MLGRRHGHCDHKIGNRFPRVLSGSDNVYLAVIVRKTKTCSGCRQRKPLIEYYRSRRFGAARTLNGAVAMLPIFSVVILAEFLVDSFEVIAIGCLNLFFRNRLLECKLPIALVRFIPA